MKTGYSGQNQINKMTDKKIITKYKVGDKVEVYQDDHKLIGIVTANSCDSDFGLIYEVTFDSRGRNSYAESKSVNEEFYIIGLDSEEAIRQPVLLEEPTDDAFEQEMECDFNPVKKDLLQKVQGVIEDRDKSHGDFKKNFTHIAESWSKYLGKTLHPQDVAMMMILLKIARIKDGEYNEDDWIDIIGYANLGGQL